MTIIIILYIVALVVLLSLSSFLVYKMINSNRSSPDEFIGLLTVLSSQIQTELDAYDKSIFENKGSITNNNFDNYYNDNANEQILFRIANCNSLKNLGIEDKWCIHCHTVELISIDTNNDIIQ